MTADRLDGRGLPIGYQFRPEFEIPAREAAAMVREHPGAVLLDVRTAEEFQAAHVPGAVHIPLPELESRRDELDVDADTPIAVMCHHGFRSLKATLMLRALGLGGARSVVGGIDLWSLDVDPSVPRYDASGGRIQVRPPSGSTAGA